MPLTAKTIHAAKPGDKPRDEARALIRTGADPVRQRRHEQHLARLAASNAFETIALEWHATMATRWSEDHAARVLKSLERDAFPAIGRRPIDAILPPEVLGLIRVIEKRDALEHAGRVLQRVGAVFRYAVQTGRAGSNPAAELTGVLKTRKVTHRPALPREELPAFLVQLDAYDGHPLTRMAMLLLILTWTRPAPGSSCRAARQRCVCLVPLSPRPVLSGSTIRRLSVRRR